MELFPRPPPPRGEAQPVSTKPRPGFSSGFPPPLSAKETGHMSNIRHHAEPGGCGCGRCRRRRGRNRFVRIVVAYGVRGFFCGVGGAGGGCAGWYLIDRFLGH